MIKKSVSVFFNITATILITTIDLLQEAFR